MKQIPKSLALILVVAGFTAVTSKAQIVSYTITSGQFNGISGDSPSPSTGAPPTIADPTRVTATDYNLGAGFDHGTNAGLSASPVSGSFASSLAGAETANDYYTLTIAPTIGYALDLTSIDLSGERIFSQASGPMKIALESSVTGFGTQTTDGTPFTIASGVFVGPDAAPDIALSSAFSDLTSPVTFRFYLYGGGSGQFSLPFDAVTGNGTDSGPIAIDGSVVTAPEPSTYALLGLGLAMLVVTVRSRRASKL